jgi:hypothetical protein
MSRRFLSKQERTSTRRPGRRWLATITIAAVALESALLWLRTAQIGGNVVVRCREGHLFTTLWIPGGSLKALRLGWWRVQRCPVGQHWSLVTPVRESDLTAEQRQLAREHHDIRIP